ncbi:RHS repeat domain-containing protein [Capnocytophaga sp. ARDL2]|uniref:RHS repeat domain-containing protein n=1 Tax=Capnocytophaga sp. ARDL2 TaxID=3238809 RepID=UPI0035565E96
MKDKFISLESVQPSLDRVYYYNGDHLKSSTYVTDDNGRPVAYYDYLPFGEVAVEHNQTTNFNNGYKFNGKELDQATGMYYYGARYYDPRLSVFISVDPLAEQAPDWTPYRFGFNNPIRYTDLDGRWEWDAVGNLKAQKGDNSYTLAKFLGTNQKNAMTVLNRGGVTANDKGILNLKEGQVFSKNDLWVGFKSGSGAVVNNSKEAVSHYFNGKGASADVGDQSTRELLSSSKFQEKHTKITSEVVDPEGYFSVDLTKSTFHIGRTNVDYSVSGNGKSSSVTYTLFSRDGFWDPDFIDENTLGKIPIIRDWTNTKPDEPVQI